METAGGKWLLLLSQFDATSQYEGSISPLTEDKNPHTPSVSHPYSRNWRAVQKISNPGPGDEFLLKRGSGNEYVRFVVSTWCGWGDETTNCETKAKTRHSFLATGKAYDENDVVIPGIKYFNGCTMGGLCGKTGVDGIGFGSRDSILRATKGDRAFGVTAYPGDFRWNQKGPDVMKKHLPYTYWYRPGSAKGNLEIAMHMKE